MGQRVVDGEVVVMARAGPVTYGGAGALLTGDPSPASGRAVIDSRLHVIHGDDFRAPAARRAERDAGRRCA